MQLVNLIYNNEMNLNYNNGINLFYDSGNNFSYGNETNFSYGNKMNFSYDNKMNLPHDYGKTFSTVNGMNLSCDNGKNFSYENGMNYSYDTGVNFSYDNGMNLSYDNGLNISYDNGLNISYDNGLNISYANGLNISYANGLNISYDNGLNISYDNGLNISYDNGMNLSYDNGMNFSYDNGMNIYDNGTSVHTMSTRPSILDRPRLLFFTALCIIAIIILGVTGNALTIIALTRCPKVRTDTAAFVISLSVADFIFCCINLPFSASRFLNQKWVHGDTLCILFPFLRYVNIGISLFSITAIAVNRYICIVHPSMYPKVYQKRYIAIMLISIWCCSIAMMLPTLLGVWGRFGYDPTILNCSILKSNGYSSKRFLFGFGFLVPCLVISICYGRIYCTIRQSKTRLQSHSETETVSQARRSYECVVTRMMVTIFLCFLICYLPITVVKIADQEVQRPEFHIMGYLLIYLSACINPVIYGIMNTQYRQAYKSVFLCKRSAPSVQSEHPSQKQRDCSIELGTVNAAFTADTPVPNVSVAPDTAVMADQAPDTIVVADQAPDTAFMADQAPDTIVVADQAKDAAVMADQAPDTVVMADQAPDADVMADQAPDTAVMADQAL